MKFTETRRAGWDTETTSADPTAARVVTAALTVRGGGRPESKKSWVINPGIDVPTEASDIHGYTTERVQAEGRPPVEVLDEIASLLANAIEWGMPLVAFNTSFDWTVLHCDLLRHGLPTVIGRIAADTPLTLVDPHVIDKQYDRYVKGSGMRKLKPTAERYGIEITDWHTADADAEAALGIAEAQFERWPALGDFTPHRLYLAQQMWRGAQQADLQDHFRKTDPAAVTDPGWPLLNAAEGVA